MGYTNCLPSGDPFANIGINMAIIIVNFAILRCNLFWPRLKFSSGQRKLGNSDDGVRLILCRY